MSNSRPVDAVPPPNDASADATPAQQATEGAVANTAEPPSAPAPEPGPSSSSIQVFSAPSGSHSQPQTPSEVDEVFFEPSLSDVQSYHATVVSRSKRLNEAPLLTSKHRDEDRQSRDKKKAEKWPNTTIRVKFSDGTQIQSTFPSSSAIQPVYAFVRGALQPEIADKPFTLWQPPRFAYPEHPKPQPKKTTPSYTKAIIPPANYGHVRGGPTAGLMGGTGGKETLGELGLVPQSVLMVKWDDEAMNVTGYPAPIRPELMEKVVPLPAPTPKDAPANAAASAGAGTGDAPREKKIPKWLQKGLMKKK